MDARSLFVLGLMTAGAGVSADLRMASQPKRDYVVKQRNAVKFVSKTALYMEPSDFNYQGLKNQRNNAYDNFLRSNIDNEQDKRNFNNEAGRDHLPFRSYEAAALDTSNTVKNKIAANSAEPAITATPGSPYIIPLRWNNPHASELEVNVWIMNNQYVVPIRKPTCSGEGRQDNVFAFTIPSDFNLLGSKVPGFTGCKQPGDCVLQIYAHSVEPRTYSMGTPLIVTGPVPAATAVDVNQIEPARPDPGTDLSKQPRELCLSSSDPAADITSAVPRMARLVSDQYNHAYQNSDYSPYSGQQPEAISKNLQASVIISMIPGNRGELGKALLKKENPAAAAFQAKLANKVQNLVKKYEGVVNNIIAKVGNKAMKNTATVGAAGEQKLANSFRAAEVGSTTTNRLTTNTYVPSFLVPPEQLDAVKKLVPSKYAGLINDQGIVQIYQAVLNDMKGEFNKAAALGLEYQGPAIKTTAATMADATQFKKRNAQGRTDGGIYAAQQAKKAAAASQKQQDLFTIAPTPLLNVLSNDEPLPETGADDTVQMVDTHGVMSDSICDDDAYEGDRSFEVCNASIKPLFTAAADGAGLEVNDAAPAGAATGAAVATAANTLMLIATAAIGALVWA